MKILPNIFAESGVKLFSLKCLIKIALKRVFFSLCRSMDMSKSPPATQKMTANKADRNQSPKPHAATRVKSPEAAARKSITSLGSAGSVGAEAIRAVSRSPSPTSKSPTRAVQAPLPEIQITRTESNRSTVDEKWVKPEKMDDEKGM